MPYARRGDLPQSVRSRLPLGAQTVCREAFNSAVEQYDEEATARRVAWAAVKKGYRKSRSGDWRPKR